MATPSNRSTHSAVLHFLATRQRASQTRRMQAAGALRTRGVGGGLQAGALAFELRHAQVCGSHVAKLQRFVDHLQSAIASLPYRDRDLLSKEKLLAQ